MPMARVTKSSTLATRMDQKLDRIKKGKYRRSDFIIADAKDPDMGPGLHAHGPHRLPDGSMPRLRTRAEFLQQIRDIIKQDIVDIMLTSASNLEQLKLGNAYKGSKIKAAIRANDTTDIWRHRGAVYHNKPARPFRTANLARAKKLTDLGLYSMTFTGELDADLDQMYAFADFREEALLHGFSYFLEVFNPNVGGPSGDDMPRFVNDAIIRCLAGLTEAERPRFLKIAYNGPRALEELASFDPALVVGVLGGGAGTTRDCFELIYQAEKYGARVALFGRKINLAESPFEMIKHMRAVADGELSPSEAVKSYHGALAKAKIKPARSLADDNAITEAVLKQD
jgi:DhnA family fructose-bisphosphate aldolase class Ia